jgi:acetyl esterase/lipase
MPLIVWLHGGGWKSGSKADCYAVGMVHEGYAVASVEYRFSQNAISPAQIQDCQAALRWLRAQSREYGIDLNRVGVWGASAGGHLAALMGTTGGKSIFPAIGGNGQQSDRVLAVCNYFGPCDFTTVAAQAAGISAFNAGGGYTQLIGSTLDDVERTRAVSPATYVGPDSAAFLMLHGTADELVPYAQSVEMTRCLQQAGVEATLKTFEGAGHGGPAFHTPEVQTMIQAFFDRKLKGAGASRGRGSRCQCEASR